MDYRLLIFTHYIQLAAHILLYAYTMRIFIHK